MKLLIVEDDVWLGEMYESSLRRAGYEVSVALNAAAALKSCDETNFDLLIVDIFLPEFNGFALLHELRTYLDTKELPVVLLSSVEERTLGMHPSRWREYGVVKYLYKPQTKPTNLVKSVHEALSQHKRVAA